MSPGSPDLFTFSKVAELQVLVLESSEYEGCWVADQQLLVHAYIGVSHFI